MERKNTIITLTRQWILSVVMHSAFYMSVVITIISLFLIPVFLVRFTEYTIIPTIIFAVFLNIVIRIWHWA